MTMYDFCVVGLRVLVCILVAANVYFFGYWMVH